MELVRATARFLKMQFISRRATCQCLTIWHEVSSVLINTQITAIELNSCNFCYNSTDRPLLLACHGSLLCQTSLPGILTNHYTFLRNHAGAEDCWSDIRKRAINHFLSYATFKQDRQRTYNVTLRRVHKSAVVEKQYVLHICVCVCVCVWVH